MCLLHGGGIIFVKRKKVVAFFSTSAISKKNCYGEKKIISTIITRFALSWRTNYFEGSELWKEIHVIYQNRNCQTAYCVISY